MLAAQHRNGTGRSAKVVVARARSPAAAAAAAASAGGCGRRTRRSCAGDRVAVHLAGLRRGPEPDQPVGHRLGRVGGDQRAVDRADRGAEHQVGPDAGPEQGAQHAHLDRAEHSPAAEHERHRTAAMPFILARARGPARRAAGPGGRRTDRRTAQTGRAVDRPDTFAQPDTAPEPGQVRR